MRVLHFFKTYLPRTHGGVERVIGNLCRGGRRHGIDASLLTVSDRRGPYPDRVDDVDVEWARPGFEFASTDVSIDALTRFRRRLTDVDLVHYHFPWPMMDVAHLLLRVDKPTVVTYHSDIVRQKYLSRLYAPLMYRFLNSADRVVATSPPYVQSSAVLNRLKVPVSSIPLGIADQSDAVDSERAAHWRERLGPKFFLFVGVLRYYKGIHVLLDAMKGVDYPLVLLGGGQAEADLREQASRLGLKNVVFLGVLSDEDKLALIQQSWAIVFPSIFRTEAFGITLIEGAQLSKPLISTELSTGTSYVNANEQTGLVVPPSDPAALRAALVRLWENEAEAVAFGNAARARYKELFTIEAMCEQYAALYRELL